MTPDAQKRVSEAKKILVAAGVPLGENELATSRRQDRLALALLAVANIKPGSTWSQASIHGDENRRSISTREIISFWNTHYGESLSKGSYDDVRRRDLVWLVEAGIVLASAANPNASTNDPTRGYAISAEAAELLRSFEDSPAWKDAVQAFTAGKPDLRTKLARSRKKSLIPVRLPSGKEVNLSPGDHNEIQRAIVEDFLPRYGYGAEVLYLGDSTKKLLHLEQERLKELGFFELSHDMLPDVVAYSKQRKWIYLIEAVHSSNPFTSLRHVTLERLTKDCVAPRIYVSAFKDRASFRGFVADISWETEVWIASDPEHLIHFNGDKFLGPYAEHPPPQD